MIVEAPSATQPAASESIGIDTNPSATAPQQPTYILQVRSYNDPDQADARRAEIILNGLSADVVKSTENGQIWYRVISGPYDTQDAALAAQQTLQHSGIDSIVIKRK
ncbi:cell division protein FtsN [compost metagenome]